MFFNKIALSLFTIVLSSGLVAQTLPDKKKVLASMQLANSYFMNKWSDPGKDITVKEVTRPSNIWTRAVYYEGLMELYKIDKQKSYYDYAMAWGNAHKWGLRKGIETRNADNQCAGQIYFDLYKLNKNAECIKDIKASLDLMMKTDDVGDWNWIDAIQMAMPVFVRFGVEYKDTAYFNRMYAMYAYAKYKQGTNGLYNAADK
jgi:unsaturated rhamnogalacturonyl hydrolase